MGFTDYLKENFTTQDGLVKLVMALALFVVLVPKYGLAGLNLGASSMEPDMTSVAVHGVVMAAGLGLGCAVYTWAKEKYLEKDEEEDEGFY